MFEWYGFKVYTDARPELYTEEINKKESIDDEIYAVETGCIDYNGSYLLYAQSCMLLDDFFDRFYGTGVKCLISKNISKMTKGE